jgi:hypothetical protein
VKVAEPFDLRQLKGDGILKFLPGRVEVVRVGGGLEFQTYPNPFGVFPEVFISELD